MTETEVVFEVKKRYHFFSSFFLELVDVLIVFEVYLYDTPKCEIRLDQEFLCTFGYVLTFLLFQRCMLLVLYIFHLVEIRVELNEFEIVERHVSLRY